LKTDETDTTVNYRAHRLSPQDELSVSSVYLGREKIRPHRMALSAGSIFQLDGS
jgi:hypothetical protein